MPAPGVVALGLAVVHGGVEVEIVVGLVGGQGVAEHGGAFEGERGQAGRHATKQGDVRAVHQASLLAELVELLLVILGLGIRLEQFGDLAGDGVNFGRGEEGEGADWRLFAVLAGAASSLASLSAMFAACSRRGLVRPGRAFSGPPRAAAR